MSKKPPNENVNSEEYQEAVAQQRNERLIQDIEESKASYQNKTDIINRYTKRAEGLQLQSKQIHQQYQQVKERKIKIESSDAGRRAQEIKRDPHEEEKQNEILLDKLEFTFGKYLTKIENQIAEPITAQHQKVKKEDGNIISFTHAQFKGVGVQFILPEKSGEKSTDLLSARGVYTTLKYAKKSNFVAIQNAAGLFFVDNHYPSQIRWGGDDQAQESYEQQKQKFRFDGINISDEIDYFKDFQLVSEFNESIIMSETLEKHFGSNEDTQIHRCLVVMKKKRKALQKKEQKKQITPGEENDDHNEAGEPSTPNKQLGQQDIMQTEDDVQHDVSQIDMEQQEVLHVVEQVEEDEQTEREKQWEQNPNLRIVDNFYDKLPLLQQFLPTRDDEALNKLMKKTHPEREGFTLDNMNCFTFSLLMVLLLLSYLYISVICDISAIYYSNKDITELCNIDKGKDSNSWMFINNYEKIRPFFDDLGLINQLFKEDEILRQRFSVVGKVRLRNIRVQQVPCDFGDINQVSEMKSFKCFAKKYTKLTKVMKILNEGSQEWQYYRSEVSQIKINLFQTPFLLILKDDLGVRRGYVGRLDNYESGGYLYDIPKTVSPLFVRQEIDKLFRQKFFTPDMRALFITFTLFNKYDGFFTFIEFFLELTPHGIYPKVDVVNFIPSLKNSQHPQKIKMYQLMRIITISLFSLVIFIITCKQLRYLRLRDFFGLQALLNYLVIFFTFYGIQLEEQLESMNINPQTLVTNDLGLTYTDLGQVSSLFNYIVYIYSWGLFVIIIRITFFLNYVKPFQMIIQTIEIAINDFAIILLFIGVICLSIAFLVNSMLGDLAYAFMTINKAWVSVWMMTMGLFDFNLLGNDLKGNILKFIIIIFLTYFVATITSVMLIDTYRFNYINEGMKDDQPWTPAEVLHWFFFWLPHKTQLKLHLIEEQQKDDEGN